MGEAEQALRQRKMASSVPTSITPSKEETKPSTPSQLGVTPDGTVFPVPKTRDMVSTILDPRTRKNEWDGVIIATIALHGAIFFATSGLTRKILLLGAFTFWRLAYNAGIGWVLHNQSSRNYLVTLAQKHKLFDEAANPARYRFLKRQLADKISDFNYEASPVEYKTWLLFRRGVELILMLDFCSYCLMATAWAYVPETHGIAMHTLRWVAGWVLILFNLWVKLDANRVVGDYSWHWGDNFFGLKDADLTFDGVYELCMHPMYSLGYAGFYGISLLACSYAVLFVSIAAHISQFLFLYIVEEPHIAKTYNPKTNISIRTRSEKAKQLMSDDTAFNDKPEQKRPNTPQELTIFRPFDPHRATDLVQILSITLGFLFAVFTPQNGAYRMFAIGQAFAWRLLHSAAICYTLHTQSSSMRWTKHFLKYGESPRRAWLEWKAIYALSLTFTHVTFLMAFWKCYSWPVDWQYSTWTLRHVLGLALVVMHVWMSISIYGVLGDYGWYFGDFWSDEARELKYTGVYRYLNNPERIVYSSWGLALMSNSTAIVVLAAQAQVLNLAFISLVEKPHMDKVYGKQVRKEAGFTRSLKSMPVVKEPLVRKRVESIELTLDEMLDRAVKQVAAWFGHVLPRWAKAVAESKAAASRYSHPVLARSSPSSGDARSRSSTALTLTPSHLHSDGLTDKANAFHLGEAIRCDWKCETSSAADWIGIYSIADNLSREVTRISSRGRWSAVHASAFADHNDGIITDARASGTIELRADALPWQCGTYELRYHRSGTHDVLAVSQPIEVTVPQSSAYDVSARVDCALVERDLLDLVRRLLSGDPHVAAAGLPESVDDEVVFADDAEKYATRIAHAVKHKFGVQFAWQVVASDGTIRALSDRICQAKIVLAPLTTRTGGATKDAEALLPPRQQKESQWT